MEYVAPLGEGPVGGKGHCQTAGPFFIPCLRCGECCRTYQVRVDLDEAARLAEGLGMRLREFLETYADKRWPGDRSFLLRQENGHCVFLRSEVDGSGVTECAIHSFKPTSCREWCPSLGHVECRRGMTRMLGISWDGSGEVVTPEEGSVLIEAHLEELAASRRN